MLLHWGPRTMIHDVDHQHLVRDFPSVTTTKIGQQKKNRVEYPDLAKKWRG